MAYSAPTKSSTPPPIVQGVSETADRGLTPQGDGAAGFAGVGLQTPSGVSVLTAALLPSDNALSLMTKWLFAWLVFFLVLFALDRTRIGHALLYYALTLAVVFTALVEWRWFATVLEPITGTTHDRTLDTATERTAGDAGPGSEEPAPSRNPNEDTAISPRAPGGTGLEDTADLAALTVQPF